MRNLGAPAQRAHGTNSHYDQFRPHPARTQGSAPPLKRYRYSIYQYMRLTNHTDYGLRLLMLSAGASPEAISIAKVATQLSVSRNHLMKVAQNLAKAGLMEPVRGRSGGFRLAKQPSEIRLGDAIRSLELETGLVECMRKTSSDCPMLSGCRLPRLFREATDAFFHILDGNTLDDLVRDNTQIFRLSEAR